MKDVKWMTHNCTVGFLVAGMWNNRYYSSTNSTIATCNRSSGMDMLASGDADGYLRMFRYLLKIFIFFKFFINSFVLRYPCISSRAEYGEAKVYSGNVACARFLVGDHYLVTVGGTDASLMLWELIED